MHMHVYCGNVLMIEAHVVALISANSLSRACSASSGSVLLPKLEEVENELSLQTVCIKK